MIQSQKMSHHHHTQGLPHHASTWRLMSWIDVIMQDSGGRSGMSLSGGASILIDDIKYLLCSFQ
jgi:hypothetical protein